MSTWENLVANIFQEETTRIAQEGADTPEQGVDNRGAGVDHPGAREDHPGVREDNPGAIEDHPGVKEDHPGAREDHQWAGEDHLVAIGDHPEPRDNHLLPIDHHPEAREDNREARLDNSLNGVDDPEAREDSPVNGVNNPWARLDISASSTKVGSAETLPLNNLTKHDERSQGDTSRLDDTDMASSETGSSRGRTKQSGYWRRLKKKWNRKGVVEIDIDHHRYTMLECVREGMRDLLLNHPDLGPKEELAPDDYTHILKNAVQTTDGQVFHFASYASSVFATVRRAIGLDETAFLDSIAPQVLPYLEFISNSKSGQHFYLTNDKMYFMKTDKEYYINYLLNILGEYLEHFLSNPHSLIVKYLGLFSVQVKGQETKYFYVMQSIFYPDERIDIRYDIKGCMAGRYQEPPEEGSDVVTILKDQNFVRESINLGGQREWFQQQIRHDTEFMKSLGVQDYSLLVGVHELHRDEKDQHFSDIVSRVQTSIHQTDTKGSIKNKNNCNSDQDQIAKRRPTLHKGKVLSFLDQQTPEDETSLGQNRRLLPKSKNPLHIIDGPTHRYYIGIIDFFTLYECRQRTGRLLKTVRHCCGDHSTIPPPAYGDRFYNFIAEHTE